MPTKPLYKIIGTHDQLGAILRMKIGDFPPNVNVLIQERFHEIENQMKLRHIEPSFSAEGGFAMWYGVTGHPELGEALHLRFYRRKDRMVLMFRPNLASQFRDMNVFLLGRLTEEQATAMFNMATDLMAFGEWLTEFVKFNEKQPEKSKGEEEPFAMFEQQEGAESE